MNRAFMSDNTAGADSRIMQAVMECSQGFEKSYGNDIWTKKATYLIKEEFGADAQFYPVLTGTGANVVSLASILKPFQAVVCADTAHINVDECGAPERFLSSKIISIKSDDGKLKPADVKPLLGSIGFEHHSQPKVISISQLTETGVVYTRGELAELSAFARENEMFLHIDGSRLANAAAHLGCSMGEACSGADVISLGGTKNGMMMGEAVVFLSPSLGSDCKYYRKQSMQLFSKMRYISAQFVPYISDKIWLENAEHANDMARMLAEGLEAAGYPPYYPVNGNAVFVPLPEEVTDKLYKDFEFYIWDESINMARLMCSFATTEDDVKGLLKCL